MGHRMHHKGLWVTGVKIWCLGLCLSASMLMQGMGYQESALVHIGSYDPVFVEYGDCGYHSLADDGTDKGLLRTENPLFVQYAPSIFNHFEIVEGQKELGISPQQSFNTAIKNLPSGRQADLRYIDMLLTTVQIARTGNKEKAQQFFSACSRNDFLDMLLDADKLGLKSTLYGTFFNYAQKNYLFNSEVFPHAASVEQEKVNRIFALGIGAHYSCKSPDATRDAAQNKVREAIAHKQEFIAQAKNDTTKRFPAEDQLRIFFSKEELCLLTYNHLLTIPHCMFLLTSDKATAYNLTVLTAVNMARKMRKRTYQTTEWLKFILITAAKGLWVWFAGKGTSEIYHQIDKWMGKWLDYKNPAVAATYEPHMWRVNQHE